jgi:3-oxoacyl-[acyl-carrier protein] reductase
MPNPIAVVTGASRGIGRAIALRLSKDYEVVAVARTKDDLDSLARDISQNGGSCRPCVLDITDPHAVSKTLREVDAHVLVNNAGVGYLKPFVELTRDEWTRMVNVNFNALFDVTRAVLPAMMARKSGHIVVIGSIAGRSAFAGGTCYAATKHAVMAFTECLMLEVRDAGVKVSVVNPGSVATDFGSGSSGKSWALGADDVADAVAHVLDTPPAVLIHRLEVRTLTAPKKS